MKIHIIAVGQRMPDWVLQGWQEYARRMPAECSLEIHEIKAEPRTSGKTAAQMMLAEAKRISAAIPAQAHCIALDERGVDLTTVKLSQRLQNWRDQFKDVAILIGGPDGLDPELKRTCPEMLRLSSLTLPHPMVRILLAEQLYRAWTILTGHPYHRS
ncbi:23S rRNA (pseudouridine(1915)-N(3))-methyltransferase RlmH [Alcaligenes endophyticus]|uniref:Ribosomal RNA large subunit methyltransferase H n=1 Tax=Alcaligenes endophyticus TaxID=1929088 RepID=A0ABT8EHZ1_9BURK|nr:23S rRNA (pseudouridine(1915)-N(3))-methyltransferase RlmH [Alcaligenes endophyticus]MCX5592700.1 23S rRNA (pseudouridine(1915)-N(3))-methyltransferase RlmH [Alcaligenes endophyticus]MDN4120888.1 23S rRNA (pseudouridine(1915)-N(3))-methyltransferase RlmH [Alcaligenes endophyticus]